MFGFEWRKSVAIVVSAAASYAAAQNRAIDPVALLRDPAVKAAIESARANESTTIADQIRYCEIPAPSFREAARADALRKAFEQLGLASVRIDRAGNVLGDRPGQSRVPRLVVAAHLDTVFPDGTDVRVKHEGSVLRGPAIGDNCRGLAVLVAIVRALQQADVRTPGSITFVANVGEEGLGDLRGVKALLDETLKGQVDQFLAIDGTGLFAANVAVGSRRYRVTFRGPGGHSFADFGVANPIHAMGRAIEKIGALRVPSQPRTTFNVGRVGGGTSVNAIPNESWMEVDLRSSDARALAALDAAFQQAIEAAVVEENDRWGTPRTVTAARELVGERPAGATSPNAPIMQTALAAAKALGVIVALGETSSDANIPIQMKIPALTIGAGGRGAHAHAIDETFDTSDAWRGTEYAVLLTIALAR
jgi:acetylornithine deacetylase/succinyl-diaminopimelate desuccinylase-like protein